MRASKAAKPTWQNTPAPLEEAWRWPVELTQYDRNIHLSPNELQELACLVARPPRHGHWPKRCLEVLSRLRQPVVDALEVTGANLTVRSGVLKVLVRMMCELQSAYWGWSMQTWSEILGPDGSSFQMRHQTQRGCRQHLVGVPRRFDPRRCFAAPRTVRALIGPNPRVLADDVWAKLVWAGLNLSGEDLSRSHRAAEHYYPLPMVRALAVVWLFAGLRADEIHRLRVGCVRWQREAVPVSGTGDVLPKEAVCLLDVPTNKTGTGFTKPVDRAVGEAIAFWEQVRPPQPATTDAKTGEVVDLLFAHRGARLGSGYMNCTLIPLLCHKAGVPERDARGDITSHRARSTIASQLFNAKEPMSLFELQAWLGHRWAASTQHYVAVAPTKLAKAYADAGYFARNVRTIEVLIDQGAVKSGAAADGKPWRFYDLGHGLCTYEFFDQCPHRMACAKCAFYRPKGSSQAQLLEAKANLLRLRQEIPLTDDEAAAVDDGLEALERLHAQLADVPTPAGPTPRELGRPLRIGRPILPASAGPVASARPGAAR